MQIRLKQSKLNGVIDAPPSKSFAHRLLLCAMLSGEAIRLTGIEYPSDDIKATIECISALGCVCRDGYLFAPRAINKSAQINCRDSGSLLRFILPILSTQNGVYDLYGSTQLFKRPITDLTECLAEHGAKVECEAEKITISGKLEPGEFAIRGDVSSQFITGLLFALPLLDGDSTILLTTPLTSVPYVGITLDILSRFGIRVMQTENGFFVPGRQRFYPDSTEIDVEGDWSSAAFWLCGAALSGKISIRGLNCSSVQGDKKILEILSKMGANIYVEDNAVSVEKGKLLPIELDVDDTIDLVPVLAVLCAFAEGRSVLKRVDRLRYKESDRIKSTLSMINSLGGKAELIDDSIAIYGKGLKGGNVCGCNDHRIVMSAMIAALKTPNEVTIFGAEAMNKSYPDFMKIYVNNGGIVYVDVDGQ